MHMFHLLLSVKSPISKCIAFIEFVYYISIYFLCLFLIYTLSGRIGKVVATHAEVARSIPAVVETAPIYTMLEALKGYCT